MMQTVEEKVKPEILEAANQLEEFRQLYLKILQSSMPDTLIEAIGFYARMEKFAAELTRMFESSQQAADSLVRAVGGHAVVVRLMMTKREGVAALKTMSSTMPQWGTLGKFAEMIDTDVHWMTLLSVGAGYEIVHLFYVLSVEKYAQFTVVKELLSKTSEAFKQTKEAEQRQKLAPYA